SRGDGTFGPIQTNPSLPATAGIIYSDHAYPDVAVGDVNGDGHLDLALQVTAEEPFFGTTYYQVEILLGNGDGTFTRTRLPSSIACTGSLALADMDGDGKLDLICGYELSSLIASVRVALGNGDGTFRDPIVTAIPGSVAFL